MNSFTGSISIIGASTGGNTLLTLLLKDRNVHVVGITDKNPDAPGLLTARSNNIFVAADTAELLAQNPDIVINVTGDNSLTAEINAMKAPATELIDGNSVMLFCHLIQKRLQAKAEIKSLLEDTRELYRIGISIASADSVEDALDTLLIEALRTVGASAGSIALYNEKEDSLVLKAIHGFSPDFSRVRRWKRRSGGMTDHILSKRVPTVITDTKECSFIDNTILLKEGTRSLIAVPLFANDRVIGILYIDDFSPRQWKQKEVEFLTLLGIQAAFAIEKFRLIEEISDTKSYLQNVLDNSADIVMTTDTEGRVVEFNKGATRVLGYLKADFVGHKAEGLWVRPEERREILKKLESEGYVANYETELRTKDGRVVDISLTLSSLRNDDGKLLGTVGVSKDITEKKRLERAVEERNLELQEMNEKLEGKVFERTKDLEKANRELARSNSLKSQFIATMSHELRTPLNSILGFSELLLDNFHGELSEKQKRHVQNIYNSGSHLLQLINNILDLAKIESGKMELHLESFSLKQPIAEVQMVIKSLADRKKQVLTIKVDDNFPLIKADRIKFKQILYNLLSNAVKFTTEDGSIILEASLIKGPALPNFARHLDVSSDSAHFLKLSIMDSGIGIKVEDRERIFSEFEQGDSSYSRKYEGTGLGLALTKRLVQLHGGEIAVESEEGRGSTFTIIIPLFGLDIVEKPPLPIISVKSEEILFDGSLKGRRGKAPLILVAEDDLSTSEVLTLYLVQGGYRVAHAYNGLEAVDRIRELKPFAVLLDIMLPEKDGWEILQEVKMDPELKDIPIIISSIIDNRELGFALGATDYMVKPVDRMGVLSKLEHLSLASKRRGKSISVLCIDDHEDVLELLTGILEPAGYNVLTANSGKSGVEKAMGYKPDLVILDLMMPEMDGFEVVQFLKGNPVTEDIPILILTAKDLTVDDRLRLAGKIETFVQKSHFTKEDLLALIKDLEMTYPARAGLLDEVSGLFDSSYFQIRLAQEVNRADRYKHTFTTVAIDLDNFTEYIKEHGISRANICIRKVADILRKGLRGSDIVVRCGIDEFAVVLSGTPKESAEAVAGRFLAHIDSYPFYGEESMPQGRVTASIAVVNYPQDALSPEEIMFRAHRMLREIKNSGGRRVQVYGQ
jgi:diguanylate cyclase (GGDEF)-like protein/PAS domain S-box-containing protein